MSDLHPAAAERILPHIPGLQPGLRWVALHVLTDPRTTPDAVLILADALGELVKHHEFWGDITLAKAVAELARRLRDAAPGFVPGYYTGDLASADDGP